MHRKLILTSVALIISIIFSAFTSISPASAASLSDFTVTPVTWNVIGLDSNDPSTGPDTFPVGARVCNKGSSDVANVTASFNWTTANPYLNLRTGSYGTSLNPYPAVTITAGSCYDFYFEVVVTRTKLAYDTTARYSIDVAVGSLGTLSTPKPRELYIEHLISQSRNSTNDVKLDGVSIPAGGTMALLYGKTYNIQLVGSTATNGYDQVENYINFPNTIFKINKITTTYTANAGTDALALSKLYADGCNWVADPNSPYYRSCLSTGKYGGNITVTYNVTIIGGVGTSASLNNLIYDFSGSSYHYNSDYSVSGRIFNIVDPSTVTISKQFAPNTTQVGGNSMLSFTLTNPNGVAMSGANFTDPLPTNLSVATPATFSTVDCGTPTFAPAAGDTSISFSGGTIAANSACTVNVLVTSSAAGTYPNTSNDLFIGAVDTGSKANATLTVGTTTNNPVCTPGVVLAKWTMDPVQGTSTPPMYSYKSGKVYTATTSFTGGTQSVDTVEGNGVNSWAGTGWGSAVPTSSTLPYFDITVNTANFTNVAITFQYYLNSGNWASPGNNNIYVYSKADTGAFSTILSSAANKGSWQTVASTSAAATGATTTTFRINARGAKTTSDPLYLDNITITGCGDPSISINKAFATNPVAVAGTSALTFTISNADAVAQSGIAFTDSLPTGLTLATNSYSTCSGTLTTTAPNLITFSGGSVAANSSCTTTAITVTANTAGPHQNISGSITSTQGGTNYGSSGSARASLTALFKPTISKRFAPNPISVGGTSTLTFTITNPNPDDTLTSVAFSDTYPTNVVNAAAPATSTSCGGAVSATAGAGTISFSGGTIAGSGTCTVTVNVTSSTAGIYANTSNAVTAAIVGGTAIATDTLTVQAVHPALHLLKQISTSATGPWTSFVGITTQSQVYYKFTIENAGDVALSSVSVSDPALSSATGFSACTGLSLGLDDATYVKTCVVGPVSVVSGSHTNTATVSGTYGGTTYTSLPSSTSYATAALSITKDVDTLTYSAAGDVKHYTYVVSNTGSASLEGPVVVSDDKSSDETCPALSTIGDLDDFFDPGESITCTATYTILPADVTAGSVTNTAYATVSGVNSPTASKTVSMNKANPTITTAVSASAGTVGINAAFGDTATLTGGNSPTGSVSFALYSDASCSTAVSGMSGSGTITGTSASWSSSWTPGAVGTYYWKASYAGDANNNPYTTGCGGVNETVTVGKASPTITTMASPVSGEFGTNATFGDSASLINGYSPTGSITFTLYSDDSCTVAVPTMSGSGTISGTTATWSSAWTPSAAGSFYWKASYPGDANNSPYTSGCNDANETLTIAKATPLVTTNVHDAGHNVVTTVNVGAELHDSVTVTSTAGTPSGSIVVSFYNNGTCAVPALDTSGTYTLTAGSVDAVTFAKTIPSAGSYSFKAFYTGDDNFKSVDGSCEPVAVNALPSIKVTKTADPVSVPESGGSVKFTYTVTNNGSVPVTLTSLSDDKFASVSGGPDCAKDTVLAAGNDCSFTYTTTLSGNPGTTHTDTFTVNAVDDTGNPASDNDSASVTFTDELPSISVTKTADPIVIPRTGGDVTFTYKVTNDSKEPVTITSLSDDQFGVLSGDIDCHVGTVLPVAGDCSFSDTFSVPAGEITTPHVDRFTAQAADDEANTTSSYADASVSYSDVLPSITVTNVANPTSVPETGEDVDFTFTVHNSGTVPVTITSLTNDEFGTLTGAADCQVGTALAVGASCSFDETHHLSGAASTTNTNVFTANAEDTEHNTATDNASSSVTFTDVKPTITVDNVANPTSVPETGGDVDFTFTVANSGTVPVTITSLTDDEFGTLTGAADCQVGTTLAVGASCSFDETHHLSGAASTTNTNVFTANAEDTEHNTATDNASSSVTFTDVKPTISVSKTADPVSVPDTGADVTFTYTVTNTGPVDVTLTSLKDDKFTAVNGDTGCEAGTVLHSGKDCSFTYKIDLGGPGGTTHTDTFTAEAQDADGNPTSAKASADVTFVDTGTAILGAAKELVSSTLVSAGTYDVTYSILVKNYGSKDLTKLQVVDNLKATFPDPTTFIVQSLTSSTFTVNTAYNGDSDQNLLKGTDPLSGGSSGTIKLVVRVQPANSGPFNNSAVASAELETGEKLTDVSQNGTDPDPDHDLNTEEHDDPTPVSFGENLFDPPAGIKTVDATGKPILVWTMVWINNANHFAVTAMVHDPISTGSTFTPTADDSGFPLPAGETTPGSTTLGVSCTTPSGSKTITTACYYQGPTVANPRGQIIWMGSIAPDFGVTDPAAAANAIHISFSIITNDGVTSLTNTAYIDSDLNGNGTTTDAGETNVASVSKVWGGTVGPTPTTEPTKTADIVGKGQPVPSTGFAPGKFTPLAIQPADKAYQDLGNFWLEIPSLGIETPIVGVPMTSTGWDITWLGNQAGWLDGTAYPTWAGNSVLTGHVYNADGTPGVFVNIAKLKYGDQIIIHAFGQKYIYEVRETKEITPDNISAVTKHEDLPWLTLVTCRGYDASTSTYRYRYIVRAVQIKFE